MIIDARKEGPERIECDICIVGAGAAGISMALEMDGTTLDVVLLESGGFDIDADTQALYEGETIGHPFGLLDVVRLRFFGGTTNHWEGMSRPLDPIDFQRREWVDNSGWPITYEEFRPYYDRASEYCQLGRPVFSAEEMRDVMGETIDWQRLTSEVFRHSPPTRFGEVYRKQIENSKNIRTFLHANLTSIEATERAESVSHLVVKTLSGRTFSVAARAYVIAGGGIENVRMLLNSTSVVPAGLGNSRGLVGRYFMEHPIALDTAAVEMIESNERIHFYDHHLDSDERETHVMGFIGASEQTQREKEILNCGFILDKFDFTAASPAIQSMKKLFSDPSDIGTHISNIWNDFDSLYDAAYRKIAFSVHTRFHTRIWLENAPDPDSRIMLNDDLDALGLRRVTVDWRINDQHLHTYEVAHEMLARELGRLGIARMQMLKQPPLDEIGFGGSFHHLGGTRMSDTPDSGVVDRNCRIHGMDNLFVAGGSVFPTCGHANPTTNLIAMALRLSDHLRKNLA